MEIKYGVTGKDRKALVMAIAEITGAHAIYKGVPTCHYEVDYFMVDKTGTLFFDDLADSEEVEHLLEELAKRGFVGQQEGLEELKKNVAAYCRVSTDQEEQLSSYENRVRYYTEVITRNPDYELVDIYVDEGISGTNTKKRDDFNRMIADCRAGKIDLIITKSISRFARNTLDCLNYVRELKDLGIGIVFEKENINTLDAKGEVLLTILSSLAQDESRSISENCTWGIRRRFEQGKHKMSTKRFLGYDTDEEGHLVVNRQQAKIVVRLYEEFMSGKTVD